MIGMSKSKIATIILIVIGIIAAGIIAVYINLDKSIYKTSVDVYFLNQDGTGIVAEPQKIKYKTDEDLIRNTLDKLRIGPKNSKLGEIMPRDTQITRIELSADGFLTVDFSNEFLTDDPSRNVLNVYAVVKTLCSTVNVSSVKVLVDGEPVVDRDKKPLEYIDASDINLETEEYKSERKEVVLYFADNDKKKLVRQTRTIKITDQQPIEQYVINELIKGTSSKGMKSLLSDKTVLVSVDVEDQICYLNFKSEFLADNAGTDKHEELVIYSIVNSLTELNAIMKVQFYMDGKRVENFGSVSIKDYIDRNERIIKKETDDEQD